MKKKLIFNLIVLPLVIGTMVVFVLPLRDSVKTAKREIKDSESELATLNELLAKTKIIKDSYEQVKSQAEKVFISLPKEKDLPDLMVQFESLAAVHGLVLESIGFGDFEKGQSAVSQPVRFADEKSEEQSSSAMAQPLMSASSVFRSLPVNLTVSGSYAALKKYVSGLEENIRSMNVQSIGLSGTSGGSNELSTNKDNFTFDLELSVYYQ